LQKLFSATVPPQMQTLPQKLPPPRRPKKMERSAAWLNRPVPLMTAFSAAGDAFKPSLFPTPTLYGAQLSTTPGTPCGTSFQFIVMQQGIGHAWRVSWTCARIFQAPLGVGFKRLRVGATVDQRELGLPLAPLHLLQRIWQTKELRI